MADLEIKNAVTDIFNEKKTLKNLDYDANFFDCGVSSLTVVDLQIKIEEKLNLNASTSDLMRNSTINGWIGIYTKKAHENIEKNSLEETVSS